MSNTAFPENLVDVQTAKGEPGMPDGLCVPFLVIVAYDQEQSQTHLNWEVAENVVVNRLRIRCMVGDRLKQFVHRGRGTALNGFSF